MQRSSSTTPDQQRLADIDLDMLLELVRRAQSVMLATAGASGE
jgi:hypothetical protein